MSPKVHPNPTVPAKQKSTYAMMVSYDGKSFPGGYEINPSFPPDNPTVQGTLTDHITNVAGIPNKLWVATAGRTDAKVSAKGALVSFAAREHIADHNSFIDELNNCIYCCMAISARGVWLNAKCHCFPNVAEAL